MTEDGRLARVLLARKLLASDRLPLVVVWCPPPHKPRAGRKPRPARHRLGRVYDMPDGGPVLCVHGFSILSRDFFVDRPDGPPVPFPPFAYPLTEDKLVVSRCDHGTYTINPVRLRDDVARARLRGKTQNTIGSWTGHPGWPD
jgi:hypothetical protein